MRVRRATAGIGVLLVIVLALGVGLVAYLTVWDARTSSAPATPVAAGPTPSAVASASSAPASSTAASSTPAAGAAASAAGVRTALAGVLASSGLQQRVLASVVDAASGTVLLDQGASTAGRPASTTKIITATAVLATHQPTDRITTEVVRGATAGQVVLVGGGDPTLSAAAAGQDTTYADAARLSTLAAEVHRVVPDVTQVVVDDSLFTGPVSSPGWDPEDVPSSSASAITALMADGGRDTPGAEIRSADPATSAAQAFAGFLGVSSVTTGTAPAGAAVIARVQSATYATLVAQMLQPSDDVIAECLARQVAIAAKQPASFTGASAATRTVLAGLGVTIGTGLADGSGLAETADTISPAALTAALRVDATSSRTALRYVLSGLPVAGWSGSLADRYLTGASAAGAGLVRAKTGTLSGTNGRLGVSSLAGEVRDRSGRLLLFSFIADRLPAGQAGTDAAKPLLDQAATTLAGCGCT